MNSQVYNGLGKYLLYDLVDIINRYCLVKHNELEIMYYAIGFRGLLEYLPGIEISSASIPRFKPGYMRAGLIEEYVHVWNIPPYCRPKHLGKYVQSIYRPLPKEIKTNLNLFQF